MFLDCCVEMSCNKVEISKTATKSKGREEALCCSTERGKLTTSVTGGASRSRVSSGAVVQIVVGAATTGCWRLTQLRPQRAASSPAGIGGPGIVPFFNFFCTLQRGGKGRKQTKRTSPEANASPQNPFQQQNCSAFKISNAALHSFEQRNRQNP